MNGLRPGFFLTPLLFAAVGFLVLSPASAQQAVDAGIVAPRPKKQEMETVPLEKSSSFDITGIVAQAFNMKRPLRMLSPLAPASAGDGRDNVSWDPDKPEKPKGIILLGIQW